MLYKQLGVLNSFNSVLNIVFRAISVHIHLAYIKFTISYAKEFKLNIIVPTNTLCPTFAITSANTSLAGLCMVAKYEAKVVPDRKWRLTERV